MGLVTRHDRGTLGKPVKDPTSGFLRVDGHVTRSGVFEYKHGDGKIVREYRPPDEVFKADSLASGHLKPVADDHPAAGLITTADATRLQRGAIGEMRRDGNMVAAPLLVTDAALIAKMEAGKVQVSCGYTCETDPTPGTTPDGQRYDAVQRNIAYNHVAIVDVGRAGPEVSVRMDSAVMVDEPAGHAPAVKEQRMPKVRIDSVEYEVTEQVAQAIAKQQTKLDEAQGERDTARGERDTAQADAKREKARADAAEQPEAIAAKVAGRVALEVEARKHLGQDVKLDASDDAVRVAVVEKLTGEKLDAESAKSAAYVKGRFDSETKRAAVAGASLTAIRIATTPGARADAAAVPDFMKRRAELAAEYAPGRRATGASK